MSTDDTDHGKLLTTFLQSEWDNLGVTRGEWCRKAGIADSTVLRWGQGVSPDLRNLRLVADALGRSLVDLLFIGGFLTEREMKGKVPPPRPLKPTAAEGIQGDATLSPPEKDAMMQVMEALRAVSSGKSRVTVSSSTKRSSSR